MWNTRPTRNRPVRGTNRPSAPLSATARTMGSPSRTSRRRASSLPIATAGSARASRGSRRARRRGRYASRSETVRSAAGSIPLRTASAPSGSPPSWRRRSGRSRAPSLAPAAPSRVACSTAAGSRSPPEASERPRPPHWRRSACRGSRSDSPRAGPSPRPGRPRRARSRRSRGARPRRRASTGASGGSGGPPRAAATSLAALLHRVRNGSNSTLASWGPGAASGWNCAVRIGSVRCRKPSSVPSFRFLCVASSSAGRVAGVDGEPVVLGRDRRRAPTRGPAPGGWRRGART